MKKEIKPTGKWLRILSNQMFRIIDSDPGVKCIKNMTGRNAWLIGFVGEKEEAGEMVLQKDIEEEFGITRSAVSKALNLLEERNLIMRQAVCGDARLKNLVLTDDAKAIALKMKNGAIELENCLMDGFSTEEKEQLNSFFERMRSNLENLENKTKEKKEVENKW